jgi:mannose-6-phosphate isomerase-like protein (cupin superfamily)
MANTIIRCGNAGEFLTREGCHITELVNDPLVARFSLADARVEPGVTTELHKLDVDEWYVIRRGRGRVEVNGAPWVEVAAGDCVIIPAGMSQRIENTGSQDLMFQCICLPGFSVEGYASLAGA